jgi:hypothetical protein
LPYCYSQPTLGEVGAIRVVAAAMRPVHQAATSQKPLIGRIGQAALTSVDGRNLRVATDVSVPDGDESGQIHDH